MKSYMQVGCTMQALLEDGFALSIRLTKPSNVPQLPLHWAHGIPAVVGTITITNEGPEGFHIAFSDNDGTDSESAEKVVEILRHYAGNPQERHPKDEAGMSEAAHVAGIVLELLNDLNVNFQEFMLAVLRQRGYERDEQILRSLLPYAHRAPSKQHKPGAW